MFIMTRKDHARITIQFYDLIVNIISFFGAYLIRSKFDIGSTIFIFNEEYYLAIFVLTIITWVILFRTHNPLPSLPDYSFKDVVYDVIKRVAVGTLFILSVTFLIKGMIISRLFIIIFSVVNLFLLIAERRIYLYYNLMRYRRGEGLANILLVGGGRYAKNLSQLIETHADWGVRLVEMVDEKSFMDVGYLHKIKAKHIDLVMFAAESMTVAEVDEYVKLLGESGIKSMVYLGTYFPKNRINNLSVDSFLGYDFLDFNTSKTSSLALYLKYSLDKIAAVFSILLLSPIMLLAALIILIADGSPVVYVQKRVGLNGQIFKMFKFRTMRNSSEEEREKLKEMNDMTGPVFKIKRDPRITKTGRILRKFSIDELPQFFNILKGDMSFVGPRPPLEEEVREYKLWHRKRLSMKPGLTCTWQISGRNEINFTDWMYMDMEYIDHWSLLYDIIILLRTIPVVLSGKGT